MLFRSCGDCSTCRRIMAVIQSRYLECESLKGKGYCGNCSSCRIRTKRHPDIHLVEPEKTTISIDQIRQLIGEIAYQPLEARYRMVVLDPAEQMRAEAHNSMLKTLEEPPSRTIIILVTTNPYMLLDTIRSRCRMLQFGGIPQNKIEQHLVANELRTEEDARLASVLCGGSLAAALDINSSEYLDIRKQALHFVALLLRRGSFTDASTAAVQANRDKQFFQLWLESVTALLQDIYYAGVATDRVGQRDLLEKMKELNKSVTREYLVRAINGIKKLKSSLQFNVNRQIAVEALFVELVEMQVK